ncbi:MAG: CBS domain-containing protein [Chloroflexi bacterium]|nr:CBS domain-containing protein [Chloroflexota bacterium]
MGHAPQHLAAVQPARARDRHRYAAGRAALADRSVIAVGPTTTVDRMAALFEDPDVQTLAVMNEEGLAGIVTRSDLLRVVL